LIFKVFYVKFLKNLNIRIIILKQLTLVVLFLSLIMIPSCKSLAESSSKILTRIVSKPSSSEVGGAVGTVNITLDKDFRIFKQGKIDNYIYLRLYDVESGKVRVAEVKKGLYFFLNVKPGFYYINSIVISRSHLGQIYELRHNIEDRQVIHIESGRMTVIDTMNLAITNKSEYFSDKFEMSYSTEKANKEILKGAFTFIDTKNYWRDFEW